MYRSWDEAFLALALFNTNIGMRNVRKNDDQKAQQDAMNAKIDLILQKLDSIERRLNLDGKDEQKLGGL